MRIGDKVTIYQYPYTREDVEGDAIVKKIISQEVDGRDTIYRLLVQFPGESETYERQVVEIE